MAQNSYGERVVKICFPYDLDMIMKIRTLPGRKYHADIKCWSTPVSVSSINSLVEWEFSIDNKLKTFIEKTKIREAQIVVTGIPGLNGTLYPFQNKGVAFIETNNGRALIADEMGLGKTIQALAWLQLHPDKRPVIIIVPASVKLNWKRETEKWLTNPNVEVLSGETPWKPTGDIIVINYDILLSWVNELKKMNPQVLITDECHYYKSNKAFRTKAIKKLGKGIPHVIALSGTPIINRPVEAYNAIQLINPDIFPNFFSFTHTYCNAKHTGFGWDFNGHSNDKELHEKLTGTIMIRRLKKDVLPDLPDKVYSFIPIELDNVKEYKKAEEDFIAYVKQEKGIEAAKRIENVEALAKIEGLKQLAVKGKLEQAIEWIKDFIETDNKLVVFCTHKFVIEELMKEFEKIAVKIDGGVSMNNRQKAIDSFQNNKNITLFVGNKAAEEGITLTAASNIVHLEYPWSPKSLDQRNDRCHRMGQKNSVTVYYLIAQNTIEEKLIKLLDEKRKIIDGVIDGTDTPDIELLTELIKLYK